MQKLSTCHVLMCLSHIDFFFWLNGLEKLQMQTVWFGLIPLLPITNHKNFCEKETFGVLSGIDNPYQHWMRIDAVMSSCKNLSSTSFICFLYRPFLEFVVQGHIHPLNKFIILCVKDRQIFLSWPFILSYCLVRIIMSMQNKTYAFLPLICFVLI